MNVYVLLHDPADEPDMKDQGFVVAPGTHTLVTILQKQVKEDILPKHCWPWPTYGLLPKPEIELNSIVF